MIEDDPGLPDPRKQAWWTEWIVRTEKFAYGELKLTPEQFGRLTIAEYAAIHRGYYRRRRRVLEDQATWICVLVNHFPMRGKAAKTLRVEQLIGHSPELMEKMEQERMRKRRSASED